MKTNRRVTHEGAEAAEFTLEQQLERSVLSCLLWEKEFYEDGEQIAERIQRLVGLVSGDAAQAIAERARHEMYLRHVPLLICVAMARHHPEHVAETMHRCVNRVDELSEAVSLYWKLNAARRGSKKSGRRLSHQFAIGLRRAFLQFDDHQFATYSFDKGKDVKLRDVMRLVRPDIGKRLFHAINTNTLKNPDTWEQTSFDGRLKAEDWERLIVEKKIGYMALLRNLRNMDKARVKR